VQLAFVGLSLVMTSGLIRRENNFNYTAILEVACLFIGIFVCMQVPIEILNAKGGELGINTPTRFFWATGVLSSFLDNAPTYVVFFETANAMTTTAGPGIIQLVGGHFVREDHLIAISLGAVFMGANTYIGNGPNFMVKSIAEHAGIKMPSFFGFMVFSVVVLVPTFVLINLIFLV
jgi:Na+/H+ antiporter NhaD/arsenite permease-like protein